MIEGNLADVAFPNLLQLLHLSARSGTLYLERDGETAYISFHLGRIASAWCPGAMTVVDYLRELGRLRDEDVERARAIHEGDAAGRSLGQVLLSLAAVTPGDLRHAVGGKIQHAVLELVGWRRGSFRFVAEEVRYDEELLFVPDDLVPQVDLDTQVVLMEALRLFDERGRESRPSLSQDAARALAAVGRSTVAPPPAPAPAPSPSRSRVDVVTRAPALFQTVSDALGKAVSVSVVPWTSAGAPVDGDGAALVVCDLRGDVDALERVARLHRDRPDCAIVAVVRDLQAAAAVYERGASAVVPPDPVVIAACCTSLVQAVARTSGGGVRAMTRVREFLQQIRSGFATSNLSVNLMAMIAQFADRGVLFAVRRDTLAALTAFGRTGDGVLLGDATRRFSLVFEEGGSFELCFRGGYALDLEWDHDDIPDGLRMVLGRPAAGRAVLFPVMGARRPIAVIYADNGDRTGPVTDVEVMELATGQFGLAIENEILRRQTERKT